MEHPLNSGALKQRPFNTEAEGGCMVQEWDFEAGTFFEQLKKIK